MQYGLKISLPDPFQVCSDTPDGPPSPNFANAGLEYKIARDERDDHTKIGSVRDAEVLRAALLQLDPIFNRRIKRITRRIGN
ncbi:hypothetical protein Ddc_03665 [Ditylenchus destructor]|nr:hypothetical protein Ddc_03665 [Ditylenchus destructor]